MPKNLYHLVVDALFECQEIFTKEELKTKLEEKEILVKDIQALIIVLLEKEIIKTLENGSYQMTVEKVFKRVYPEL